MKEINIANYYSKFISRVYLIILFYCCIYYLLIKKNNGDWGLGIGDLGFGLWVCGAAAPDTNPTTTNPKPKRINY